MEEGQPLNQRQEVFSSYQATNNNSANTYESSPTCSSDHRYGDSGLETIRRLLDRYPSEAEASLPSLSSPFPSTKKQNKLTSSTSPAAPRFFSTKKKSLLRSGFILLSLFCVLTVGMLHNMRSPFLPTEEEIALTQHYYGDYAAVVFPLISTTSQIRYAQKIADQAVKEHLLGEDDTEEEDGDPEEEEKEHGRALGSTSSSHPTLKKGCESTVVLVRHCEKGFIVEHCAYEGYERSIYLASLFGNSDEARWPLPSAIFAQSPDGRNRRSKMNFREVETVGPLAKAANLSVDDSYSNNDLSKLGRDILHHVRRGDMCGKTTVVVWKHSRIAHVARTMGCGPKQGCPVDYSGKTFDQVWQIKFVYQDWEHSNKKDHFLVGLPDRPSWKVFGSVQYENFDPLAVSKQFGDYPEGGIASGGHWKSEKVSYPERKKRSDTAGWKQTKVGFPRMSSNTDLDETKDHGH